MHTFELSYGRKIATQRVERTTILFSLNFHHNGINTDTLLQMYGVDWLLKCSIEHASRLKLGPQPDTRAPSLRMLKHHIFLVN